MNVQVISPTEVRVNGENLGAVADVIANHPNLASDIQRALEAWAAIAFDALKKQVADCQADQAEAEARHNELRAFVTKAEETLNIAGAIEEVRTILKPDIDRAKQTERERQLAELEAEEDKINADCAKKISEIEAKKAQVGRG